jgi:hypothetical protein
LVALLVVLKVAMKEKKRVGQMVESRVVRMELMMVG